MAAKSEKSPRKASDAKPAPKTTAPKTKAPKTTASKTTARKATSSRRKAPVITNEMIAERAYHIALSGTGASDFENWVRAESELLNGAKEG